MIDIDWVKYREANPEMRAVEIVSHAIYKIIEESNKRLTELDPQLTEEEIYNTLLQAKDVSDAHNRSN